MKVSQMLLISCLLAVAVLPSAAAELQQVSLREAITRSLERNHQSRAAAFEAEASRAAARGAALHYLPSLTVEEAWTRSNLPVNTFMMKLNQGRFTNQDFNTDKLNDPAPTSDFRSSVMVEQPLLVPEAWAAQRSAARGAERQEALSEHVRQQIGFQVFLRYLEVHKTRAYLQASEKAVAEARESHRQAVVRTGAGMGLKSDELRAATHLAAMEQQAISRANDLVLARMQLALATGGQPGDQLDAVEPAQLPPLQQTLEQLTQRAHQQRQDLQASERGKQQADAALLQARSGYLPTVGAFGSWQMNDPNTPLGREHDAWAAGVTLRWNLFNGLRTWHAGSQASATRSAAAEQLEQTRKEISYQVQEAWLRRIEAEKRLEVARSAVSAAEEATRILSKRFDNSLATMFELLDAQSATNQSRANLVESEASLLQSTGRIYFVAGIFLKEVAQ